MTKTHVYVIRSDSSGLYGVIRRCRHHAKNLLPIIRTLLRGNDTIGGIKSIGLKAWGQGEIVQHLTTVDDRLYVLRAYGDADGYKGVRLLTRVTNPVTNRGIEVPLLEADSKETAIELLRTLSVLAKPHHAEWGHRLCG